MRRRPQPRFQQYSFTIKPAGKPPSELDAVHALRLVWHDYPGRVVQRDPSSEEAVRRAETFTDLLKSDVALVLVDGQELLDYAGEEEKYLKSMLWGLQHTLDKLKDDILPDGKPLPEFPRIWVLALSKADLHPTLDVQGFRDLVVEKAAGDVAALRETLQGFVQLPESLSLGRRLPAALLCQVRARQDQVTQRRLVLDARSCPSACSRWNASPWADRFNIPLKMLGEFVDNTEAFAAVLTGVVARSPRSSCPECPRSAQSSPRSPSPLWWPWWSSARRRSRRSTPRRSLTRTTSRRPSRSSDSTWTGA